MLDKTIDPIDPEIVFFGLIFVSLTPLKILPNTNPPISDAMHPARRIKIINLNCKEFSNKKKDRQKINT